MKSNVDLSVWVAELVKCIQKLSHIARKLSDMADPELAEKCLELSVFSLQVEKEVSRRVDELIKQFNKDMFSE